MTEEKARALAQRIPQEIPDVTAQAARHENRKYSGKSWVVKAFYRPKSLIKNLHQESEWAAIKAAWSTFAELPVQCAWCNRKVDPGCIEHVPIYDKPGRPPTGSEPVCNRCLEPPPTCA